MEETHQRLSGQLEIFTSIEIIKINSEVKESIRNCGYDGTAIYIEDKENKVNQLHIISQGSQEQED